LSWIECINPFNVKELKPHMFFRYTPKSKYFNQGDTAKLCPVCYSKAHLLNQKPSFPMSQDAHRTLKNPDSKPEKDSL